MGLKLGAEQSAFEVGEVQNREGVPSNGCSNKTEWVLAVRRQGRRAESLGSKRPSETGIQASSSEGNHFSYECFPPDPSFPR